jgi:hypothetical protein
VKAGIRRRHRTSWRSDAFLDELNKLRELDPIHWSEASRCWLITRHSDVDDALHGRLPLSLRRIVNIISGIPEEGA